jgi:gluconokinase
MDVAVLIVSGVAGSGKTTIGKLLARRLGWPYAEADAFHSAANLAKMAAGHPLTDDDRWPWLTAIAAWIDERIARGEHGVVSCSALRRCYRDVLRRPETCFVYLRGSQALIAARLAARKNHFFKAEMLDSQFSILEEPSEEEQVISVANSQHPDQIVDEIIAAIQSKSADAGRLGRPRT